MLPFMAKALLIWGEPAPRREVSFDWPVAESNGGSYWRTAGRLICIRSDRARVTPRLKHAGKDLKGTAPRAARTGRRGGGNGDGYRRYRPEEPGLRYPSFQPSLLPAPGKPSPRLPATLVGASREDAPRTRNTPPPPETPKKPSCFSGMPPETCPPTPRTLRGWIRVLPASPRGHRVGWAGIPTGGWGYTGPGRIRPKYASPQHQLTAGGMKKGSPCTRIWTTTAFGSGENAVPFHGHPWVRLSRGERTGPAPLHGLGPASSSPLAPTSSAQV